LISAASPNTKDTDQTSSVECCICLNTLAPYQALFLSPCTHCFHYKCVYPLLGGGIMFLCPLCRQVANLEATVSTDNLFEQEEDLKFSSKNSLYHNHKSNNSVLSPSSPTMDNNKKQTETNKSTPNLSKSHPNLLQPLKSKFTKSNESLNNSKEKQKNPSPNSNSSVAHNNEATSSSSKKNETGKIFFFKKKKKKKKVLKKKKKEKYFFLKKKKKKNFYVIFKIKLNNHTSIKKNKKNKNKNN